MSSDPLNLKTCPIETSKLSDLAILVTFVVVFVCLFWSFCFGLVFVCCWFFLGFFLFHCIFQPQQKQRCYQFDSAVLLRCCLVFFLNFSVRAHLSALTCGSIKYFCLLQQAVFFGLSFSVPSVKLSSIKYRVILIALNFSFWCWQSASLHLFILNVSGKELLKCLFNFLDL